ncbi:MAG: hypothetical protein GY940_22930 [bacterium]|nr:hypothetical protein [bacterium]
MKNVNERVNENKSSSYLTAALVCLVFCVGVFTSGCSRGVNNRLEVMIEMPDPGSLNFDNYKNIIYKDVALESIPKNFDPTGHLRAFFLEDLSRTLEKKIKHWNREEHSEMVPDGLALVTGKLKLDIKSRSKISEDKEEGKGKKKFITVQHWTMTFSLDIKDASTGKEIFKDTFTAKLANADPASVKFNFENLFYKVTSRFVNKVTRTKKMQRRHLLI